MRTMRAMIIAGMFISIGCARSSGILPIGPDTYTLSVYRSPARGGVELAKASALQQANAYCEGMGKHFLATDIDQQSYDQHFRHGGGIDVTFQCLARGDRDLVRPRNKNQTDVTLRVR